MTFLTFWNLHCLHPCWLVSSVLLHCFLLVTLLCVLGYYHHMLISWIMWNHLSSLTSLTLHNRIIKNLFNFSSCFRLRGRGGDTRLLINQVQPLWWFFCSPWQGITETDSKYSHDWQSSGSADNQNVDIGIQHSGNDTRWEMEIPQGIPSVSWDLGQLLAFSVFLFYQAAEFVKFSHIFLKSQFEN